MADGMAGESDDGSAIKNGDVAPDRPFEEKAPFGETAPDRAPS